MRLATTPITTRVTKALPIAGVKFAWVQWHWMAGLVLTACGERSSPSPWADPPIPPIPQKIEGGLLQVKQSGENLRELSNIVKDNSSAVRQIAAAVSQQNAGITQIFSAVTDQTRMMDETMRRLETTTQAASTLKDLSQRVSEVVGRFRV